ncbi:MAG: hypothetical protein ACKVU0_04415 [Saprospiraceae bacterium]
MNQKNIFTGIAAVLVLQGIAFYTMGDKVMAEVYPNLDEGGASAVLIMMTVVAMLSITIGLITYSARNSPQVLWAYTVGYGLILLNTSKHRFMDDVNVPIPAMVIQLGIVLLCGWLWYQQSQKK